MRIWELPKNALYPIICYPAALERYLLPATLSTGSALQGREDASKDTETIWKTTHLSLYGGKVNPEFSSRVSFFGFYH